MAINIDTELQKIREAAYGEEVRGSIHDGIRKIANEVTTAEGRIDTALANANTTINNAVTNANTTINNAVTNAETRVDELIEEGKASNTIAVRNAMAPMFSSDSTVVYNVGDYVYRLDPGAPEDAPTLYKCQTATTGGTFVGSSWIKATFGADLATKVEVNQFRFDSATNTILGGKSCDDLTTPGLWFVNYLNGSSVLSDFPINGEGFIRISGPNVNRLMQQVYPADLDAFPYRLIRTKNFRSGGGAASWSPWYKSALTPLT